MSFKEAVKKAGCGSKKGSAGKGQSKFKKAAAKAKGKCKGKC